MKRNINNEHRLILLLSRLKITFALQQEIKKLLLDYIDWGFAIKTSKHHDILPFLYYNINELALQSLIPADIFLYMKNYYYSNLKKNILIEKEIYSLLKTINSKDIAIIPFKGFALIQTLYHNPGLRVMADIDLLIRETDLERLKIILTESGYIENQEHNEPNVKVFLKQFLSNRIIIIEIHDAIVPARPYKLDLPDLWNRAQEKIIDNEKISCLSPEDTFLSLALHLRRHTRRLTLKFILDLAELLNTEREKLDWHYIIESAKNNHILTTVYCSIYLAKELLDASIPADILNKVKPHFTKNALLHYTVNKYNFLNLKTWRGTLLRFLLFDNILDFTAYLRRVCFLEKFITKIKPIRAREKTKK